MKKVKVVESRTRRKEEFKLKILTQISDSDNPLRFLLGGATLEGTYDKNWLTCSEFKMHIHFEVDCYGMYNVRFVELNSKEYTPEGRLDLSNKEQIAAKTHVAEKIMINVKDIMFILDAFQIKQKDYIFHASPSKQVAFTPQFCSIRKSHMRENNWMIPKFDLMFSECDGLRESDKICYHELSLTRIDFLAIEYFELPDWLKNKIEKPFIDAFQNYPSVPMPQKMTSMRRVITNIRDLWHQVSYESI